MFLILEGDSFSDKCDSKCDSYPQVILFDEKKMISNAKISNNNSLLDRFKDINPKEINWFIF